ncbi:hypothetical protein [Brevibacillus laterosporus]|uniref:hypothetical protein n=1 Tax=Brevibacillus laterosporus TaxID=1465 RepID=UPI00215C845A|nr:hypothetical protein [Brevibacillus laterosporus]MCR8994697.1 hypothetical protein [Brevibacillus laterosporus]
MFEIKTDILIRGEYVKGEIYKNRPLYYASIQPIYHLMSPETLRNTIKELNNIADKLDELNKDL